MGLLSWLVGGGVDKVALIRRLLRRRIEQDSAAAAQGVSPAQVDSLPLPMLLGLPEATIVTCVETWAQLRRRGAPDSEIARAIAAHRGCPTEPTVDGLIRTCVAREHARDGVLGADAGHVEWCIKEARAAYGF